MTSMTSMTSTADRRDYDTAASASAQDSFDRVATRLESLVDQRSADVRDAMSDYEATGVSGDYQSCEQRWTTVATEVRGIVQTLRRALADSDASAQDSLRRARSAVEAIG